MGKTRIEWADAVWNPVAGCTPVSEGCAHCYAARMATRLAGQCGYPADEPFRVTLHKDKLEEPLHWASPRRVFVVSMGDLFHPLVPREVIADVFNTMAAWTLTCRKQGCEHDDESCWHDPGHTYLILTKRPQRMKDVINDMPNYVGERWPGDTALSISLEAGNWPLPDVWLGVSAENQARADERIPILLSIPAAKRFVSCEPLLSPIDLTHIQQGETWTENALTGEVWGAFPGGHDQFDHHLDWVITGGETGPGARPMEEDWARSLVRQCRAANVAFFMKQGSQANWRDFKNFASFPEDLRVREFPDAK